MYSYYTYNVGATQADILNDVVAILTGTTDVNTLSTTCNKTTTTISTIYEPAGWTVHDAAAITNGIVIKSPCDGDANQFKYVMINTAAAGYVRTILYDGWNAGTHAGTNMAVYSDNNSYSQRYSASVVGTIHIFSSQGRIVLYSTYSGATGNSVANAPTLLMEVGRAFGGTGVGSGILPAVWSAGGTNMSMPIQVSTTGTIATNPNNYTTVNTINGASSWMGATYSSGTGLTVPGGFVTGLVPIGYIGSTVCISPSEISKVYHLVLGGSINPLDELTYNSQTYVILLSSFYSSFKMAIPKG